MKSNQVKIYGCVTDFQGAPMGQREVKDMSIK